MAVRSFIAAMCFGAVALAMGGVAYGQAVDTGDVALGADIDAVQAKLKQDGFSVHEFKLTDPNLRVIAALSGAALVDRQYPDKYTVSAVNGKVFYVKRDILFPVEKPILMSTIRSQLTEKYGVPGKVVETRTDFLGFWFPGKSQGQSADDAIVSCDANIRQTQAVYDQAPGPTGSPENYTGLLPKGAKANCLRSITVGTSGTFAAPDNKPGTPFSGGLHVDLFDGRAYFTYLKAKSDAAAAAAQQKLNQAGANKANGL